MDGNKGNPSAVQPSPDSHIPPPTDPYITYQTPYPRKPSDEIQNPFIEFRRLADAAFSSFFSGLPKFLGTDKFKEANIRESDEAFVRAFDEQAKEFESRIAEMVRVRAEEAEGLRKKLEQEWEERRRENEKRMEEESQRWDMMRRGLEKCPGLRPEGTDVRREAESELDLYDGLKAYEAAAYKPVNNTEEAVAQQCPWKDGRMEKNCPWNEDEDQGTKKSWLTGLGWDGRRRAKNIPLVVPPADTEQPSTVSNEKWTAYNDADMDPFTHDDHIVPWLRYSPYSPLSLIRSWNTSHNEADGYENMPWDEAFEDLMSVHKTGKFPSARTIIYWGGPEHWMTEMAIRGSLGPKWNEGFMVSALFGSVNIVNGRWWRGFDGFPEICQGLAGRPFRENAAQAMAPRLSKDEQVVDYDWVRLSEADIHSRPRSLFDQIEEAAETLSGTRKVPDRAFGPRGMLWPTPEEVLAALSEGIYEFQEDDKPEDGAVEEYQQQMPSPDSWSTSSVQTPAWNSADDKHDSVISTLTTTTSRTLPDGSVETKRVLKQRFADGREENSESTEVQPAVARNLNDASTQTVSEPTPVQKQKKKQESGGGWFWN